MADAAAVAGVGGVAAADLGVGAAAAAGAWRDVGQRGRVEWSAGLVRVAGDLAQSWVVRALQSCASQRKAVGANQAQLGPGKPWGWWRAGWPWPRGWPWGGLWGLLLPWQRFGWRRPDPREQPALRAVVPLPASGPWRMGRAGVAARSVIGAHKVGGCISNRHPVIYIAGMHSRDQQGFIQCH